MNTEQDILNAANVIASNASLGEESIVQRLMEQGYTRFTAELLAAFIPLGVGRALIANLRTTPSIHVSSTATIRDFTNDRDYRVELSAIGEFEIARRLGEDAFRTGVIPREQFSAVASLSIEVTLINEALNAGKQIGGSRIAPPILLRLADVPGFNDWYGGLARHK